MTSSYHDDLLPIAEGHPNVFQCPGEPAPVSESVHLARLASGWEGCTDCVWNPNSQQPDAGPDNGGIRRTDFGVRGQYLNAVDRFRAAQLASIFSSHLSRVTHVRQALKSDQTTVSKAVGVTIAVGYDARTGSQDIFTGVVSAVVQNGCDVVDIGECTTSSLLSFLRQNRHLAGCLMVTGAGGAAGDVGIDAFGKDGRSLSVPWIDFGVGLRVASGLPVPGHSSEASTGRDSQRLATRLIDSAEQRRSADSNEHTDDRETDAVADSFLQLPSLSESTSLFRTGRTSGVIHSDGNEQSYRRWLKRWWPERVEERVRFDIVTDRVRQRVISMLPGNADVEFPAEGGFVKSFEPTLTVRIEEDDRFIQLLTGAGKQLSIEALAEWINRSSRNSMSHVTAHPSRDKSHVLLVDVASPDSGQSHEIISDGLALVGLVLTLLQNKKNRLPR